MYGKIQLDDVTKKKLSLLLKYYRKKAKLNQKEFITYNHATICSADTYSRIENQKIIKSNSIYHYLLYQMDAQIQIEPAYWEDFSVCWKRILELVTRYDIARLQTTIQTILAQFPDDEELGEIRMAENGVNKGFFEDNRREKL